MQRMSVGAVAAVVAGLIVLSAGIWAQFQTITTARTEIWIAYVTAEDSHGDVSRGLKTYAHPGGVAHTFPLSEGSAAVRPTWSPDGDKLLWVELKQEDEVILHLWDRKTGADVAIPVDGFFGGGFYWSPDSKLIFGAGDLVVVWDREGRVVFSEGPPKDLTPFGTEVVLPGVWSPDGHEIAMRRDESLVVYNRRSGLHVYSPVDFGLSGNLSDYGPLQWDASGNLPIVLLRRDTPLPTVFVLDLERHRVNSTFTGEEASEYILKKVEEFTGDWIPRRDTQSTRSSQGVSADGTPILTYFDPYFEFVSGGAGRLAGVVVRLGSEDLDIPLSDARVPLALPEALDVVVLGKGAK